MNAWLIWLILAAVLGTAELLTLTLAFALIAVAAVAAAGVAAADLGLAVQLLAFVATAGAGLGLARPLAMRHINQPPALRTGTAALRSEEHTSELQSRRDLVCRLLLEKKKK